MPDPLRKALYQVLQLRTQEILSVTTIKRSTAESRDLKQTFQCQHIRDLVR